MQKKIFALLGLLGVCFGLTAQTKFTISGTLKDKKSGEALIGATIRVLEFSNVGMTTNEYGFYSLSIPQGTYTFNVSYVGYTSVTEQVILKANVSKDWSLSDDNTLEEVVVRAVKDDENLTKATMGTEVLNVKEIAKIPVLFGEKDLVKAIQLMPGVKSNGEGSNGFSVRGGATDQNLILLDEAPVYNASHLLGFFSTFNSDAIKDATIIKGNSPAQFGGRLSSVLDVKMKEGNNKEYHASGGIGLISSRLTLEGPIQQEKSSFIISGRRTYVDMFAKLSPDFKDTELYFYDLNAKANLQINNKNKLFFSGYLGKDVLGFGKVFGSDWGNSTATIRWNSILSSKLFSNTSLIYSNYDFNISFLTDGEKINNNSNIKDINLGQDFSYYPNPKNTLRFGFSLIHHILTPNRFQSEGIISEQKSRKSLENAIYVNNSYQINDKINVDYGLRLSMYSILGGDTYNVYENNVLSKSILLAEGEIGESYLNLEPRISANYRINQTSSIKLGYARNTQSLHLLSNSTSGNPTDRWIGNSYNIKPEIADQISLGLSKNFVENKYELNVEGYYKLLQNQIDYKDGTDINTAPDIESQLLFGEGRAYGLEVLLKKKTGKLTGWIGYTLSKTERQINGINNDQWYNAKQDRTHDLSVVAIYNLSPKWSFGATFIYNTGNAVTFPTGKYDLNGIPTLQYGTRNDNRMPSTHRLDLSATYEKQKKGRFQSSWSFGLYNAYGQSNPYSIDFKENVDNPGKIEAVQLSLFRWLPSVTYNFKF
ncbi:outer membrane receptor protein involved in Fe transport [Arcicella aurantiaca]|uniref:Outer membrane receptor protein involved in Fe transport n=1 Tax=Arcicella aurantiaca TaxID=591202 RepID=A0A316E8X0_9BACT|nr:TonB-dependent receptor [Arcicella aurantiaca]PWK26516.1 outer membrane receptor protein involved in Fe transport [Arcicella aurantiaca]